MINVFQPIASQGKQLALTVVSQSYTLPAGASQVMLWLDPASLTNPAAFAVVSFGTPAIIPAGVTLGGALLPSGMLFPLTCDLGGAVLHAILSAGTGNLYVVPGKGF